MPRRIQHDPARRRRHFIKEWRDYRELTQEQLADRLSMSAASLSRIESYKQPYTQDFLEACADALRTDAASLIMRNPTDDDAIWSLWDAAKPGQRDLILDLARSVVKKAAS